MGNLITRDTVLDVCAITDLLARTAYDARLADDLCAVTEQPARTLTAGCNPSVDTCAVLDQLVDAMNAGRALDVDFCAVTEQLASTADYVRAQIEMPAAVTENAVRTLTGVRAGSDASLVSDSVRNTRALGRSAADALGITDSLDEQDREIRNPCDYCGIAETLQIYFNRRDVVSRIDRPVAIRQALLAGNDFSGIAPVNGSPASRPSFSSDIYAFANLTDGGLFDPTNGYYAFEAADALLLTGVELTLGTQSAWTIDRVDADGNVATLWSGTTEASYIVPEASRLLLPWGTKIRVTTTGASGALQITARFAPASLAYHMS
jgi:hypothetical protein